MAFDGIPLMLAMAAVVLPLLLAWALLARDERPKRPPKTDRSAERRGR